MKESAYLIVIQNSSHFRERDVLAIGPNGQSVVVVKVWGSSKIRMFFKKLLINFGIKIKTNTLKVIPHVKRTRVQK